MHLGSMNCYLDTVDFEDEKIDINAGTLSFVSFASLELCPSLTFVKALSPLGLSNSILLDRTKFGESCCQGLPSPPRKDVNVSCSTAQLHTTPFPGCSAACVVPALVKQCRTRRADHL